MGNRDGGGKLQIRNGEWGMGYEKMENGERGGEMGNGKWSLASFPSRLRACLPSRPSSGQFYKSVTTVLGPCLRLQQC